MKLAAKKRSLLGKKVKSLRREGILPAILFGGKDPSVPLKLNQNEFERTYEEAGEATILDLEYNGKKQKVLIAEIQRDPLGKLLHADLKRVAAGEKITATVPIIVEGEAPLVKDGQGILLTLLDEVEVESLPQDLPSEVKVDISGLTEIGQGIVIKDLPIDLKKVEVLGHEPEELVLKIDYPQAEEEEEKAPAPEEEAVGEVEATEERPEGEEVPGEPEGADKEKKEEPSLADRPRGSD